MDIGWRTRNNRVPESRIFILNCVIVGLFLSGYRNSPIRAITGIKKKRRRKELRRRFYAYTMREKKLNLFYGVDPSAIPR